MKPEPTDAAVLLLRVGLGGMMITHGLPKLLGGPDKWGKLGGAMAHLGIDLWPALWGFAAAFSESVGALLVVLGLLTRLNGGLLVVTMAVAAAMHFGNGDGLSGASHAIEVGIGFLALVVAGGGRYSLDAWLHRRRQAGS